MGMILDKFGSLWGLNLKFDLFDKLFFSSRCAARFLGLGNILEQRGHLLRDRLDP